MSRYSKRSQSILENLVCNDLKIKTKDLPFLPQLSTRFKEINPQMRQSKMQIQFKKLDKSESSKKRKDKNTKNIIFK